MEFVKHLRELEIEHQAYNESLRHPEPPFEPSIYYLSPIELIHRWSALRFRLPESERNDDG